VAIITEGSNQDKAEKAIKAGLCEPKGMPGSGKATPVYSCIPRNKFVSGARNMNSAENYPPTYE
jgi:hypothetical protein